MTGLPWPTRYCRWKTSGVKPCARSIGRLRKRSISISFLRCAGRFVDRKLPRVGCDCFTKDEDLGRISGRPYTADGNPGQHTAQDIKFARAHVTVEEVIHVCVGDQRRERLVAREILDYGNRQFRL